jgi:hypothetical protein
MFATSNTTPVTAGMTYAWTTSTGLTSTAQSPSFTFPTVGSHTITLVATNAGGSSAPVSRTVNAIAAPVTTQKPAVPAGTLERGLNSAGYDYWLAGSMFIDYLKVTSEWTQTTGVGAGQWLYNLTAGQGNVVVVRIDTPDKQPNTEYFRPGRMTLRWNGGAAVTVSASNISNVVSTPGVYSFDVTINNQFLIVNVSGPGSFINASLTYDSDYPAFQAGEIFSPEYVAHIQAINPVHLRWMEMAWINNSEIVNPADIPAYTDMQWRRDRYGVPPEVVAKAVKKFPGVNPWLNIPHKATDAAIDAYIARAIAGLTQTEILALWWYIEATNEAWNFAFSQGVWLRDNVGPNILSVNDQGQPSTATNDVMACAYANLSLRCWAAAIRAGLGPRLVRVYSPQTAFADLVDAGLNYVDPGIVTAGQKLGQLMAPQFNGRVALTSYASFGTGPQDPRSITARMIDERWDLKTNAQWRDEFFADLAQHPGWYTQTKNAISSKGYTILLTTYEASRSHLFADRNVMPYPGSAASGNLYNLGANASKISNGQQIKFETSVGANTTGYQVTPWVRKVGAQAYLYGTLTAYNADSAGTGVGALALTNGASSNWTNHTLLDACAARWNDFSKSTEAVAVMDLQFSQLKTAGVEAYTQFADFASASTGSRFLGSFSLNVDGILGTRWPTYTRFTQPL